MMTKPIARLVAEPDAARQHERDHARHECKCSHEDWPQTVAAGLQDRRVALHAAIAQLVRMVDLEDGVLLHHPEQHEQAQRREDVQRLTRDDNRQQRERQRQRQRQQDRHRVQPRLELRREDQIHEDQRQPERDQEVLRRAAELARAAREPRAVARSHVERVGGPASSDPSDRSARRPAAGRRRSSPAAAGSAG